MPKKSQKTQLDFKHTWFLREWMESVGLKQAALQKELGWSKGKMNSVWHGQQYTQEIIDEVAPWLNVRPYELLMPPDLAHAFRNLREDAARIVRETSEATPLFSRTGTDR